MDTIISNTVFYPVVRELTNHRVNGLNEALRIFVVDQPGSGGAHHRYIMCHPRKLNPEGDMALNLLDDYTNGILEEPHPESGDTEKYIIKPSKHRIANSSSNILYQDRYENIIAIEEIKGVEHKLSFYYFESVSFQNGPIKENGVNGTSQEALLAILVDRLEGFQSGEFKCHDNQVALDHIQSARLWLHKRTMDRVARGVEGTTTK